MTLIIPYVAGCQVSAVEGFGCIPYVFKFRPVEMQNNNAAAATETPAPDTAAFALMDCRTSSGYTNTQMKCLPGPWVYCVTS